MGRGGEGEREVGAGPAARLPPYHSRAQRFGRSEASSLIIHVHSASAVVSASDFFRSTQRATPLNSSTQCPLGPCQDARIQNAALKKSRAVLHGTYSVLVYTVHIRNFQDAKAAQRFCKYALLSVYASTEYVCCSSIDSVKTQSAHE
jgi:hypothetical protein